MIPFVHSDLFSAGDLVLGDRLQRLAHAAIQLREMGVECD